MPKVTVDGVEIEVPQGEGMLRGEHPRPLGITILAFVMIMIGAIGVLANGYSFLIRDPAYSPGLWLTFLALKSLGLAAGILLLRMRRLGVWLFAASVAFGAFVAVSATGPHNALQWLGAASAAAVLVFGFWLAIRRHWKDLRSIGGLGRA